jgi:hypothetical protein
MPVSLGVAPRMPEKVCPRGRFFWSVAAPQRAPAGSLTPAPAADAPLWDAKGALSMPPRGSGRWASPRGSGGVPGTMHAGPSTPRDPAAASWIGMALAAVTWEWRVRSCLEPKSRVSGPISHAFQRLRPGRQRAGQSAAGASAPPLHSLRRSPPSPGATARGRLCEKCGCRARRGGCAYGTAWPRRLLSACRGLKRTAIRRVSRTPRRLVSCKRLRRMPFWRRALRRPTHAA